MTEQQAAQTASLMYILSDVERMGTLSVEVGRMYVQGKIETRYKYTPEAMEELQKKLEDTGEDVYRFNLKALQELISQFRQRMIKRKDKLLDLDLKDAEKRMLSVSNKRNVKASLTAPVYEYPASDRPYGKQLYSTLRMLRLIEISLESILW